MRKNISVLVIDDEPVLQDVLLNLLGPKGYDVQGAMTAADGLRLVQEEDPDIVLLDLMLPDRGGLDILPEILAIDSEIPVIVITAYSSIETAIQAIQLGAFHYLPKPFKNDEVLHLARQAAERRQLQRENRKLRDRLEGAGEFTGVSRRIRETFHILQRAAPARSNILITGESGTGKELAARAIHRLSPRAHGPFVPVHTSAIPGDLLESTLFGHVKGAFTGAIASRKGLFESAEGGTLFLDEVGTISQDTQTKLLRVIQEREIRRVGGLENLKVDVRLVAATNVNLWDKVQSGDFREDLYYRLNVITVEMPPLRERKEDIPLLAMRFLKTFAEENERPVSGFTPAALDIMSEYAWPGNVRELENAIERAVVLCSGEMIDVDVLPQALQPDRDLLPRPEVPEEGLDYREAVARFQARLVKKALERSGGVQRQAAKLLGLSPTTFNEIHRRLLKKMGEKSSSI